MRVRRKYIRNLANQLIIHNKIKLAPVDIHAIAKNLFIQIVEEKAPEEISGFLLKGVDNRNSIIGVNQIHSESRKRFTIAHEIGHFLLHNYQGVHFDGKTARFQVYLRNEKSSEGTNIEEREANLFAAELLMPEFLLKEDISNLSNIYLLDENDESILQLKDKYQVSVRALTYRLAYLGFIEL